MASVTQTSESTTTDAEALKAAERAQLLQFVKQAQDGDRQAFGEIVKRTEKMVRKMAYSTVGPELVDDAFQESYLLVLRKLGQLKTPEAFISWFSRIVLHVCYDLRKARPTESELPDNRSVPDHANQVTDSISVHRALAQLHRRDREVLILRELLELNYEEIASALRLPVGTVRSRLHKARLKLGERLRE